MTDSVIIKCEQCGKRFEHFVERVRTKRKKFCESCIQERKYRRNNDYGKCAKAVTKPKEGEVKKYEFRMLWDDSNEPGY